jgi:putative addiction module component (TIGR02574 family)
MKMRTEEIRNEINEMGLSEKLLLVEDIWDSIAEGNAELPMAEWQKQELDKRYQEFNSGNVELHDWQTVHEGLRARYK